MWKMDMSQILDSSSSEDDKDEKESEEEEEEEEDVDEDEEKKHIKEEVKFYTSHLNVLMSAVS